MEAQPDKEKSGLRQWYEETTTAMAHNAPSPEGTALAIEALGQWRHRVSAKLRKKFGRGTINTLDEYKKERGLDA